MALPRFRAGHPGRAWFLMLVALLLARARAGPIAPDSSSLVGRPLAIEVKSGHARIDIPGSGPGRQSMVIVSAVSRRDGPFPIQLSVKPIDRAQAIPVAVLPPPGSPRTKLPGLGADPAPSETFPPLERVFHLMVGDGDVGLSSSYLGVSSRLRALGRRVQVYVGEGDEVDPATLREVVSTFDDEVYPAAARRFGPALDVDGDGRFTILLSGWLSRLSGGKVRVDGFVRGADLDTRLGAPFGNRADMMYLNVHLKPGPHLKTILAHEYTHAVTFSRKPLAHPNHGVVGLEEEGWLDEAIAHLVEDSHGFSRSNIDYRVSAFLSQTDQYRLVVDDYYAADLFRSHGNRGVTYLFLRWCVDQYGPGLIDQLVRSDLRGTENLEAATGATFADLFRRWTVALALSGLDPSIIREGAYQSVDPRGRLNEWILAGPRVSSVRPDRPEVRWLAGGTTAHYALLSGWPEGPIRVEVLGPPEAEIQVTLVELPAGMARSELVIQPSIGSDGQVVALAQMTEREGTAIELETLAWEPLVPEPDPHAAHFRSDRLDRPGIVAAFGTDSLEGGGTLRSRPIRLPGVRVGDPRLVFKAVGTDRQGRRVSAWSVVNPPTRSEATASRR